jgi:predicted dehydrogenase
MKDKKYIKIALVGARFAADLHMEAYHNIPKIDIEITGVASKNSENARAFCKRHGLNPNIVYEDANVMINEVNADIIDLVVPPFLHVPFAIEAAEAGKNVICEKPLTGYFGDQTVPVGHRKNVGLTDKKLMFQECLNDCEQINKVFNENDVVFCYAENWVYAPPIVKAKRLLKASKGKILEIRGGEGAAHPYGAAVHLKMWEGLTQNGKPIYPQYIIATVAKCRDLLKNAPAEVDHIKSHPVDVEDWSCGIITFEDGSNAVIIGSDITLGGIENWLKIYSSNTRIECKISNNNSVMAYAPTEMQFENEYTIEKTETKAGWSYAQPDENWMTGYPFEFQDFIDSVLSKKQPLSNLELAIWTTKVMYAAYLSAELGKRIEIPKEYTV